VRSHYLVEAAGFHEVGDGQRLVLVMGHEQGHVPTSSWTRRILVAQLHPDLGVESGQRLDHDP
jgi:hypothetical protein